MAAVILLTGAGGWLGSALVSRLDSLGIDGVEALDRAALDCTDAERVEAVVERIQPRTVVHLAASLARGEDPEVRRAQWQDTFLAGRNVSQAVARAGVPHLVLVGSMEELGEQSGVLTTDLPADPRTTYGLCKSLVREVARFEATQTRDLRIDWVRPTTVYGPGQRGSMLVPYACASARLGRPATFTSGIQQRDFLYVDDLVSWLALAVDEQLALSSPRGFQLHHLGTGTGTPVRDVLQLVADEFPEARFEIGSLPRRAHEPMVQIAPPYTTPEPGLRSWAPATSWEDGIKRTLEWWRSQGDEAVLRSLGSGL